MCQWLLVALSKERLNSLRDPDEKHLETVLGRMQKTCRVIKNCFLGATIVSIVCSIAVVLASIVLWRTSNQMPLGTMVYALAYGVFASCMLWNLTKLFEEVVKGAPPFSGEQADRLRAIAVIALAFVALDLLMSFGFNHELLPEFGFGMVVNDGIAEPTINLNFGMLAFSAIMYSLSAIFRYAALLQQLSDETV